MKLFCRLFLGIFLLTISPMLSVSLGPDTGESVSFVSTIYADDYIVVPITTKIPGCTPGKKSGGQFTSNLASGEAPTHCQIKKGFGGVLEVIGSLIKVGTFLTLLVGVIYIIMQGIALSSGMGETAAIKKRLWFGVIGVAMLALSGTILNMIAPWIYV